MSDLFWKAVKSFLFRSSELLYGFLPRRAVLKFYAYLAYIFRAIAWRAACRFYGPRMAQYRGDISSFILSNIDAGSSVLDTGCAEGNLTRLIASKAGRVVAVDIDKGYLDMIDKNDVRLKNARFIAGDIMDIDFGEIFDVAVLVHTIEHLPDPDAVLRKLARIARKLIVETPDEESDWLTKILRDLGIDELGDDKHTKLYDDVSLTAALERNGWRDVVAFKGYGVVRAVSRSKAVDKETHETVKERSR